MGTFFKESVIDRPLPPTAGAAGAPASPSGATAGRGLGRQSFTGGNTRPQDDVHAFVPLVDLAAFFAQVVEPR